MQNPNPELAFGLAIFVSKETLQIGVIRYSWLHDLKEAMLMMYYMLSKLAIGRQPTRA